MEEQLGLDLAQALVLGQQLGSQRDQLLVQANQLMEELLRLDGRIKYIQQLQESLKEQPSEEDTTE